MSQLIFTATGPVEDVVRLEENPDLRLGPEDLLVDMEAANINLTDFRLAEGTYTDRVTVSPPAPLGGEGVGRVVEAGPAADPSLLGRRVIVVPNYLQGTWANRLVVPARSAVPVGDGGDPLQLAMLGSNPATAYLLLNRYVTLEPGDWIGQDMANSAIGQYVITLARHAGIRTLNVVRRHDAARGLREQGADVVLVDGDGLRDRIAAALGGAELRLVLDGIGGPIAGDLVHSLEFGGQLLSYSSMTRTPVAVPAADLVYRELGVRGMWVVNWLRSAPRTEIEAVYGELAVLSERGVISAEVEATFPLTEYRDAFAAARRPGRSGKTLFTFDGAPLAGPASRQPRDGSWPGTAPSPHTKPTSPGSTSSKRATRPHRATN
jgi:NADPH:quinone reductase-like Zn-dependent oxidoreductase